MALTYTFPAQLRPTNRAMALRGRLVDEEREQALERVAALFVVLSRNNTYEGRDPSIIADSLRCGTLADYLHMSVDELSEALIELEWRGLIEPGPNGTVRLKDVTALDRLADGIE